MISAAFLSSDYTYSIEMKRALERHESGEAYVIPIILRPVFWQEAPFGKLQALPTDAKPVTSWQSLDEALFDVAEGIRLVCKEKIMKHHHDTIGDEIGPSLKDIGGWTQALLQLHRRLVLKVN